MIKLSNLLPHGATDARGIDEFKSNKRNSENKIPLRPIKKSTSESGMT